MGRRTPLYEAHLAAGATMVDFAGWDMPLHYGSQVAEHHAVRSDAGIFDVSHMRAVDLSPFEPATDLLRRLLANDVGRLMVGKALYSVMCNRAGGVIDDVIAYRTSDGYRVVLNSATAESDLDWIRSHAAAEVSIIKRDDLAILAVQGPQARARAAAAGFDSADLNPFSCVECGGNFIARTGYTGEDGLELMVDAARAEEVWRALLAAGVRPAGLGARDTLRLEAGMNLYGHDMDATVTPLEAGLAWTVALEPADRDFIGRAALEAQRPSTSFVGLILTGRGVIRDGQAVRVPQGEGVVTSGSFSPTLGRSIALARVPATDAADAQVQIRGAWVPAQIVRPPFGRHGKAVYTHPEGTL